MTAIEDARTEVLHARSDPARARANRHLDEALEAWAEASRRDVDEPSTFVCDPDWPTEENQ